MKAIKGNKEYTIAAQQSEQFARNGYDIYDDGGKKVQDGAGKTVSADEYQKAVRENAALKKRLGKLKNGEKPARENE